MAPSRTCTLLFLASALSWNNSLLCAKDKWFSVRTRNFLLVGNASEGDIRKVGLKFEQFRDAFSRLSKLPPDSPVSTTVMVFKSDNSFRPFKPLYQGKPAPLRGFFQAGEDVNFIALSTEASAENPYHVIYHEYVHQLFSSVTQKVPPWVNEGIAEYYSTFEVTDGDKKIWLGKPIANHVLFLREQKFLPLATLLAVDRNSPYYNESSKVGVFYAQSWALVHYLMVGNPQRHKEFLKFMKYQNNNEPVDSSFRKAFQTDYLTLEKELRNYIQRDEYPVSYVAFEQKLHFDTTMESRPITEADVQFYLGDFLLHIRREDAVEACLKRAIELDPHLSAAQAALGMFYLRQQQWERAKEYLTQAAASDSNNHLVHYYYAKMLVDEGNRNRQSTAAFPKEMAQEIRSELKKAIRLAPRFPESYRLLAYVNLSLGEELDESIDFVKKAKTLVPGREDLDFDLAQIYVRKEEYKTARQLLEVIVRSESESTIQSQAHQLLEHIKNVEEQRALITAVTQQQRTTARQEEEGEAGSPNSEPSSRPPKISRKVSSSTAVRESHLVLPPPNGKKASGILTAIECPGEGIVFVLKSSGKLLRFHVPDPSAILIYNQSGDSLGTMTMACGPFLPPTPIVLTYKEPTSLRVKSNGEVQALFFGKKE